MERLTKRDGEDNKNAFCPSDVKCCGRCSVCDHMDKMMEKLADYEDAEENGMLIHLPCRVGDTVYGLYWDDDYCASVKEYKFTLTFYEHCKDRFGETLFFTREAAEQALKQMGE